MSFHLIIKFIVRTGLPLLLFYWGYQVLFPIEPMEYRLAEQGLGWFVAPLTARLLIGSLWTLCLLFVLNINPRNMLPKISFVIFVCLVADLLWEILATDLIITSCYGCPGGLNKLISSLIYLVCFTSIFYLIKFPSNTDIKFAWLKYAVVLIALSLPFIFNPVWPENFRDGSQKVQEELSPLQAQIGDAGVSLIAFFSPSCLYCERAARKIAVAQHRSVEFPPIFVCFSGDDTQADEFFEQTNTRFAYKAFSPEVFYKMAPTSLPGFGLLTDGVLTKRWDAKSFNFQTLRQLERIK